MEENTSRLMHAARFSFFGLGFILFGWFAYFLAIADSFSTRFIAIFAVLMLLGIAASARRWLIQEPAGVRVLFAASILLSASLMYFAEPTIFSGRDQGSISEAAFELSRNGGLTFSNGASDVLVAAYGPGQALNFPGFFYEENGSLTTQFPLGYTSWLGAFTALFGIDGFRVANGILLALSLLSLYFLVRIFAGARYGAIAFALSAASFVPLWFAKFTLTENYALFLFLFTALNTVLFLRENRASFFLGAFLASLLLAVTRIEGLWTLAVVLVLLFASKSGRDFAKAQPLIFRTIPLLFAGTVLAINFAASIPFHTVIAKAFLKNFSSVTVADTASLGDSAGIFLALWHLFLPYGLLFLFLSGFAGIVWLAATKRWEALIPALLALPMFIYFVDPNITHDHPWMLRRFLPVLWPTLLFSSVVATAFLLSEKGAKVAEFPKAGIKRGLVLAFFSVLLLLELPATVRTFAFAENRGLLGSTAELANLIGERDLLLIDRLATGDQYAIPAGPLRFLHGKQAVYFFNPADYGKIDKDGFEHIYILMPLGHFEFWESIPARFEFVEVVSFSTERLESLPLRNAKLPGREHVEYDAVLFELKPL